MKRFLVFFLGVALVVGFSVIPAGAKDLTKRVGLGYNSQIEFIVKDFQFQITGPSIKYALSPKMGVQGIFGFNKYSNGEELTTLGIGGKFFYNIIQEDNMNFYAGGGLGILHVSNGDSENGVVIVGYIGDEFFFSGLPNLGFAAEVGIVTASMFDQSYLGTYGGFLALGIHYYF